MGIAIATLVIKNILTKRFLLSCLLFSQIHVIIAKISLGIGHSQVMKKTQLSLFHTKYWTKNLLVMPNRWSFSQQLSYCKFMLNLIANGLVSASRHDLTIRQELQTYPIGFTIKMQILPNHASFILQVNEKHQLIICQKSSADLTIFIKHLHLATQIFTFQESTAQAFANDRMTVDGDIAFAVRFVRILNQFQALILPKILAKRAIKRYPNILFRQKIATASLIYRDIVKATF